EQTTFGYGNYVWKDITVTGASGQGVATGTVTVTDNGNPLATTTLNATGVAHMLFGAVPTNSCVFGYTFQDAPQLAVGAHVIAASYSGDSNFGPMTAAPVTVTITQGTITGTLAIGSAAIAAGDAVQMNFTLAGISGAGPGTAAPTGTVTFTDTTTATVLGTANLTPTATLRGVGVLPGATTATLITGAGAHAITASWPGDANYNGVTSLPVTVTVQTATATTTTVTSTATPAAVGSRPTFTATLGPPPATPGPTS